MCDSCVVVAMWWGALHQERKGRGRVLNAAHPCPWLPAAISFVVIMVFGISWVITSRRALKDHEQLPFIHYRHAPWWLAGAGEESCTVATRCPPASSVTHIGPSHGLRAIPSTHSIRAPTPGCPQVDPHLYTRPGPCSDPSLHSRGDVAAVHVCDPYI